ncbi:MAG: MoxR family ATPase [Clostridiaceae bacterium]|nr:MoxR family ATPase [Clostridiaceae bacterium]
MEQKALDLMESIRHNIGHVMVGKQQAIDLILISLLSKGHVLLEDIPGIGKTTLVSALSRTLGLSFQRIQFTPDIMPSDITGFDMYNQKTGEFEYRKGMIMNQLVLADEINRTSPKTQSSLLEAMQENQISVDGRTYYLPQPFMVLATQNPIEQIGTYPLPEAQLDRFMMRIAIGYPNIEEEMEIYSRFSANSPLNKLEAVVTCEQIIWLQEQVQQVFCSDAVKRYVALLADASRKHPDLLLGLSPRGALMLLLASRSRAFLLGRDYVLPEDVQNMFEPVLAHRLLLKPESRLKRKTIPQVLPEILQSIAIPRT